MDTVIFVETFCPHYIGYTWYTTHTHTHTHTSGSLSLRGLSIGVMVFILYKLYILSPYSNPTPKPTYHRKLSAFYIFKKKIIVYDL